MQTFSSTLMPALASLLAAAGLSVSTPASAQVLAPQASSYAAMTYEVAGLDADMSAATPAPFHAGAAREVEGFAPAAQRAYSPYTSSRPIGLTGREPSYGPFRVIDATHAALVDATGVRTPAQFQAMMRAYPQIAGIEMRECPGTEDDLANLELGRMIRARGITTHVPAGGSVRSGGVELFLAGARRIADPGAEFAVHSWSDEQGRQPDDFAASAPENRRYVDYYKQMGMSPIEAEAFYAMTNSVPFSSARWFGAGVMSLWVPLDAPEMTAPGRRS